MKVPFIIILLISTYSVTAFAQNKVSVTQNGNGNSVSIHQTTDKSTANQSATTNDCKDIFTGLNTSKNILTVVKDDTQLHILFNQSDWHQNNVSSLLDHHIYLTASQHGLSNGFYILLPDSQHRNKTFKSHQTGSKNRISARVMDSPNKISLSQKGNGNTIAVNPCDQTKVQN